MKNFKVAFPNSSALALLSASMVFAACTKHENSGQSVQSVSSSAPAAASLRIPLVVDLHSNGKVALASSLNAKLKSKGSTLQFADSVEVSSSSEAKSKLDAFEKDVEKASLDLKLDDVQAIRGTELGFYVSKDLPQSKIMCYSGAPKSAIGLIESLTDNVFGDMFLVNSWKLLPSKALEIESSNSEDGASGINLVQECR